MSKSLKRLIVFIPLVALASVYSYHLIYSLNFHPDFTRDLYEILSIIQGNLSLLGPKSSFGGIYTGPYYFYFFAPFLFLSNLNIYSLAWANVGLFLLGIWFFYNFLAKKVGGWKASLGALMVGLAPAYIIAARAPWNGSMFMPLILILLPFFFSERLLKSRIWILLAGFFTGMIININFATITIFIPVLLLLLTSLKNKKDALFFIVGTFLSFVPLLFFELRHDFVMFKSTFVSGSYSAYFSGMNSAEGATQTGNLFEKALYVFNIYSNQLGIPFILVALTLLFFIRQNKAIRDRVLLYSALALPLLSIFFTYFQFNAYYLLPISTLVLFATVYYLAKSKYIWVLIIFLALEAFMFPTGAYNEAISAPQRYESTVNSLIKKRLVSSNDSFNVIELNKTYGTRYLIGYGYRYFFKKSGLQPKSEFEYQNSDKLIVFSDGSVDSLHFRSWEIEQFGNKNMKNPKIVDVNKDLRVFIFVK